MARIRSLLLLSGAVALASRLSWRTGWQCARTAAAHKRSRGIIQHASDAIISTDEHQHILQANPSAATMFGTTVQAMEGSPLQQFIPRDQRLSNEPASTRYFGDTGIRLRMKGRRASDYAVTGLKASGQHFPLEGSISSLTENGQRIYTIILRDITERKQVQEQLEQSYSQLRELSAALQTIREEERKHIARELHDDLGQLLATLRVDLALLQQQHSNDVAARKLQAGMDELLMSAITSLRRIASNLRPRALDEGGLYFALESLRQEFVSRYGIACTLDANEEDLILDDAYSTAIFRIAQEALTNITRHAEARTVLLSLYRTDGLLQITIHDDGRGIAEKDMDKASSFGLIGMRERVWALHGDISIVSDGGTRIMIRLPLQPQENVA
ncbi:MULTISPECIES: PAS domain-containing sensor histidine kinase [unclassified Duganella]|uniref:sensor histidine kinase n=1 Tax=unclassified Duganella TaxID=2636909 RepID=UPI000E354C0B|nr:MULTISPECIES: PAS domain-containing sensor histidine kinase [unclassified Duganella]RFP09691.1 PAS domain-containing sensor histidine kinase [Duganella sp. BJB475]RFP27811.1 PAS domain-containing sensor histidine kinase [Duganella sp. BJB476]